MSELEPALLKGDPETLVDLDGRLWAHITGLESSWVSPYQHERRWGYWDQDERGTTRAYRVPRLTTSTDDALAFIARAIPGASWQVRTEDHHENGFRAEVWVSWGPKAYVRYRAECCKTAALALCAAMLSAKNSIS